MLGSLQFYPDNSSIEGKLFRPSSNDYLELVDSDLTESKVNLVLACCQKNQQAKGPHLYQKLKDSRILRQIRARAFVCLLTKMKSIIRFKVHDGRKLPGLIKRGGRNGNGRSQTETTKRQTINPRPS